MKWKAVFKNVHFYVQKGEEPLYTIASETGSYFLDCAVYFLDSISCRKTYFPIQPSSLPFKINYTPTLFIGYATTKGKRPQQFVEMEREE